MFKDLLNKLLDLVYIQKCIVCNCSKADNFLCKTCAKDVNYLSVFPHRIYNNIPIYSASIYQNTVKKIIHLLKFSHRKKASIVLAKILYEYFKKTDLKQDYIIIYPDSFIFKNLSRGYEHMYLTAKEFALLTGFKLCKHAIKKIKNTKPQYQVKNRKSNIKNAFKINEKYIDKLKNSNILVIDDIFTTGATIEEIINILQKNKINNITCITISKTV